MSQELLVALGLVLVIEGILPFLSPAATRAAMLKLAESDDRTLRLSGMISMVLGVMLLYVLQ